MHRKVFSHARRTILGLLILSGTVLALPAEDVLFVGNSFTYGGDPAVSKNGGIPKLVELIAAAKGKTVAATMMVVGGKGWDFHLQNPATLTAITSKPWNWVVLQDHSESPTHAGNLDAFMKNGKTLHDKIAAASPQAGIVLYETWAYATGSWIYKTPPTAKTFSNPEEMMGELHKNYSALLADLQAKDPNRRILLAPVGDAFARCIQENPGINLYAKDLKHPDKEGCYLSALVIYATLFQDSPQGATATFPAFMLDADTAAHRSEVAGRGAGDYSERPLIHPNL
jgi:hypothetical protein